MPITTYQSEAKQLIKVAFKSLQVNKLRSFLTALGVIIGVASVILLVSVGAGLKQYITKQMEGVGSNLLMIMPGEIDLHKMGPQSESQSLSAMNSTKLKLRDLKLIKTNVPQVEAAAAFVIGSAIAKYQKTLKSAQIRGTTEDYPKTRKIILDRGRFFTKSETNSGRKVAVLGSQIAQDLFADVNPIGLKFLLDETRYKVIGVFGKKGGEGMMSPDSKIYIPLPAAQRQFNQDKVSWIMVKIKSEKEVPSAISRIKEVLSKDLDPKEFSIIDQREMLSVLANILNVFTLALTGIAAISLLVGGIGIMNIMLVSVTERTHEIGLRKAVGATPNNIRTQFLIEAIALSVGGGIIGIALGISGSIVLNRFMPTTITIWSILTAFFISVGIGITFGVAPAVKASRLSPIDALRYE